MSATISGQEEANAAIPTEIVNLAPGTAFDDYKGITISVGAAEMYALALETVLTLLVDEDTEGDQPRWVLKEQYLRFLPLAALSDSNTVWVRVVSEVVYMRSIDVVVQSAEAPVQNPERHGKVGLDAADLGAGPGRGGPGTGAGGGQEHRRRHAAGGHGGADAERPAAIRGGQSGR
jgi:hypothetical protein